MSTAEKAIKAAEFIAAVTEEFDEDAFAATICTAMRYRQEKTGEDLNKQARKIAWAISKNNNK